MIRRRAVLLLVAPLLGALRLEAQDSRSAAPPELRAAAERYLGEREDGAAAQILDVIVKRSDATPDGVLAALAASDAPLSREMSLLVPHRDQLLATTIRMPAPRSDGPAEAAGSRRSASAGRLHPVVFDVSNGTAAAWLGLDEAVVAFVKGYTPPEFSDEGRDAFLKVLRRAAHLCHGDPDRLWLCGFSWGGHASFDVALHRPGVARGIVPMGGGPRRTWFRLIAQIQPLKVAAFCGEKDDAELVWNLREVERLAPRLKLDYKLTLDPERGHDMPLRGTEEVAKLVRDTPANGAHPPSGTLIADAALVESPLIRIDAVDETRVRVPQRVPVSATLSLDGQRRATVQAMAGKVVKVTWRIEERKDETLVVLTADGVPAATLFLREPVFRAGRKVTVRAGARVSFSEVLAPDPKTMLSEARRTGERLRPAMRAIPIRF